MSEFTVLTNTPGVVNPGDAKPGDLTTGVIKPRRGSAFGKVHLVRVHHTYGPFAEFLHVEALCKSGHGGKRLPGSDADGVCQRCLKLAIKAQTPSLDNPVDGHQPIIGRVQRGTGMIRGSGMQYGTKLRCSCGWKYGGQINEAPSQGGTEDAEMHYQFHVVDVTGGEPTGDLAWAVGSTSVWGGKETTYWDRWVAQNGVERDAEVSA